MSLLNRIEALDPQAAADLRSGMDVVRVNGDPVLGGRRSWDVRDLVALDEILHALGHKLLTKGRGGVGSLEVLPLPAVAIVGEAPATKSDYCETCGYWSSDLESGMCGCCRERFGI